MSLKTFGKQSLIYGISTILARMVSFLLLPLYTNVFSRAEYGIVSLAYAFMGFALILYRYGTDTALMKFYVDSGKSKEKTVFTNVFGLITMTGILFSICLVLFRKSLVPVILGASGEPIWIVLIAGILFFDMLWNMAVIILRTEEKPVLFSAFSFANVLLMMALNIVFVVVCKFGVLGVLISNFITSGVLFLFALMIILPRFSFSLLDSNWLKKIVRFSLPFLPAGVFTMVMELADRYILEFVHSTEAVGFYSAGYKIGMFMLLVVMGFNMGWTPYFLKQKNNLDAPNEFRKITTIFVGIAGFFLIILSAWAEKIVQIQIFGYSFFGEKFWQSTDIVPVILLGYFFFGLYVLQLPGVFLAEKTKFVPVFRGLGALLNIGLNFWLISLFSQNINSVSMAAAAATAVAFFGMATAIFFTNRKIYPIRYFWRGILFPLVFFTLFWFVPDELSWKIGLSFAYFPMWFIVGLDNEHRQIIRGLFS